MLHVSKFHGSWQPRHSCAAILPSSRSAYFWSINLDLKFNWNFHVEICHNGSTFKLHPVYQARFGPPPPQSGAERRYKAYIINPLVLESIWKFHDLWCVPCTVMDKTSNIALNSTRMQQAHYFRHILHAEKITGRPEGGTSLHVHPINTPLHRMELELSRCCNHMIDAEHILLFAKQIWLEWAPTCSFLVGFTAHRLWYWSSVRSARSWITTMYAYTTVVIHHHRYWPP